MKKQLETLPLFFNTLIGLAAFTFRHISIENFCDETLGV